MKKSELKEMIKHMELMHKFQLIREQKMKGPMTNTQKLPSELENMTIRDVQDIVSKYPDSQPKTWFVDLLILAWSIYRYGADVADPPWWD